jgi:hypothetical protein
MRNTAEHDPIGYTVTDYALLGQERDGQSRWVGADLAMRIPPVGRFFLNVVTKERYGDECIETVLHDIARPERLLIQDGTTESRKPYVLNDSIITEEILKRKFISRTVESDLAASLWYDGPLD